MEPPGELASDGDDRHGGLVAEARGLCREIPAVQLRMLAAEADQLHIGEAEPDGVDSDEDLIFRGRRYVDPLGFAVASNAVHALPVNIPSKRAARGIRRDEAIRGVGLAHSRAFGRGRSAAFSTRPVGSRIPTFVPIVSGLAAKRSPGLIATQR